MSLQPSAHPGFITCTAHARLTRFAQFALFIVTGVVAGNGCRPTGDQVHPDGIVRQTTIHEAPGEYCAWPDIARTANGDIIVLFCKSEEHLAPDGSILLSRSTDNGSTWEVPVTVFQTPIDERESGMTVLTDGRIIGHFWSTFHTPSGYAALPPSRTKSPSSIVGPGWWNPLNTPVPPGTGADGHGSLLMQEKPGPHPRTGRMQSMAVSS